MNLIILVPSELPRLKGTYTLATPPPAKEKEQVVEVCRTIGMLRDDCSVFCRLKTCSMHTKCVHSHLIHIELLRKSRQLAPTGRKAAYLNFLLTSRASHAQQWKGHMQHAEAMSHKQPPHLAMLMQTCCLKAVKLLCSKAGSSQTGPAA